MNEKIIVDEKYVRMSTLKEPVYVMTHPFVDNEGIWMPDRSYAREDEMPTYRLAIPKETFIEAYNMWIKGECKNETN